MASEVTFLRAAGFLLGFQHAGRLPTLAMSWELTFNRTSDRPGLTLAEADAYFAALPGFSRIPPPEEELPPGGDVYYGRASDDAATWEFCYRPEPPDSASTATPLCLRIALGEPRVSALEALTLAQQVCRDLQLELRDPESGSVADSEGLVRSYERYSADVEETIAYARRRSRQFAQIGCVLLLLCALLLLVPFLRH